jgi:hypothetical protein
MSGTDPSTRGGAAEEPSLAEELKAIPYEPLLPVEKALIAWSLVLGVILLGVLFWVSTTFFPVVRLKGAGGRTSSRVELPHRAARA